MRHDDLDVSLLVSGAHLDPSFGKTIEEIKISNFKIAKQIEVPVIQKGRGFTSHSIANVIQGVTSHLEANKPDIFVVYADRFEGFAALVASTQMNIPTAHIEGGDITEGGALDDSIRHAMTKLAHLHFATNEDSRQRILHLGEEDWRTWNVGFPAIDLIKEKDYAAASTVEQELGLDLRRPIVLFTQHSVTIEPDKSRDQIRESLTALRELLKAGVQVVLTYPNNDEGSLDIIDEIEELNAEQHELLRVKKSLGRYLYHGVLALTLDGTRKIVCAGNSSSGIKETPAFGCPTVNIGTRQNSRLRGRNVIDTTYDSKEILACINNALFNADFRKLCQDSDNPYYQGGASKKIVEVLKNIPLDQKLLLKKITY
jgi:UDP-N-acetylglucosamine 2-epimerase (non-hydrolysing)/GDP/UDP-N,N'-diacetylbacillosamine 2-epimerase (hydrolysing)